MDEHHSDRIVVHLKKEKTKDTHWERLLDDPTMLKKHMLIDWSKCVRHAYVTGRCKCPEFNAQAVYASAHHFGASVHRYDKSDVAEGADEDDADDELYNEAETIVTMLVFHQPLDWPHDHIQAYARSATPTLPAQSLIHQQNKRVAPQTHNVQRDDSAA